MAQHYNPRIVTENLLLSLDPSHNKSYPAIDLPVKDGLILWLDAADDTTFSYSSGAVVSQWRDKSGLNNHVAQSTVANQPSRSSTLNSRKIIVFDGSNDSLSTANSLDLSTTHTIFAIASQSVGSSDAGLVSINNTLNNGMTLHNASGYYAYFGNGDYYATSSITGSTSYIFTKIFKGSSSTTRQIYLNGTSATSSGTITSTDASGVIRLGQQTTYLNGTIAEVIIFNRELTATELKQVHTYLGQKWGIFNTDRQIFDLSGNNYNFIFQGANPRYNSKTFISNFNTTNPFAISCFSIQNANSSILNLLYTNHTIEVAVNPKGFQNVYNYDNSLTTQTVQGVVLWSGYHSGLYFNANTLFYIIWNSTVNSPGISCGVSSYSDKIMYITATRSGNTLTLYINGVVVAGPTDIGATSSFAYSNILIGAAYFGNPVTQGYVWPGQHEYHLLRMYNKALNSSEVISNYQAFKARFDNNIVRFGLVLDLDAGNPTSYAGSGTTWYDVSGAGYNATIVNAPTFTSDGIKFFTCSSTQNFTISNPISTQPKLSQIWTVSAWINIDTTTGAGARYLISGLNNGLAVEWFDSGTLLYLNAGVDDYYTYGNSIEGSGWVMLTFLFRNSDGYRKIYSNITDITTSGPNYTSNPAGNSATFTIADNMRGKIAQIIMYNRLLTFAEITQNYNATKGRFGL